MERSTLFMLYAVISIATLFAFLLSVRRIINSWGRYRQMVREEDGAVGKILAAIGIGFANMLLLALPLLAGGIVLVYVQRYVAPGE